MIKIFGIKVKSKKLETNVKGNKSYEINVQENMPLINELI